MSWNLSSSLLLLATLLVLTAGVAGAVTVSGGEAPGSAEVGTTVSAEFTVTELFRNPSMNQWQLRGETELRNVTWSVTSFNQAGTSIDQRSADGQVFQYPVRIDSGVAEVTVKITGDVPPVEEYSYDPQHAFLFAELQQARQGGTSNVIETYVTHQYTPESLEAERAIDSARSAINRAGGNPEAEETLQNAISAYEAGNFGNAVDLANRAEGEASSAAERSQRNQMILFAGIGIVLLLVVIGGVFYWRSQQTGHKL